MVKIGEIAPWGPVPVTTYQKGKEGFPKFSLWDWKGRWIVLFFYPRDFTFICPTELKAFAKHATDFKRLNAEIVACSTDSEWSHKAWFERDLAEVEYPIIADTTQEVSRGFGILDEGDRSAQRGTFIIDPDGIVRYMVVSDGSVGRSVKETLRVLEALQTGERCPVEWEPGAQTLGKG